MSLEAASEFVRRIYRDEALRNRLEDHLEESGDTEEERRNRMAEVVPELGELNGYEFTPEEGFEALENLRSDLAEGELADEDLERVAGGKDSSKWNLDYDQMTGP